MAISSIVAQSARAASVASAAQTSLASSSASLDENTFLNLLVTQMQNQDPTQPMDDTQMVTQLAQFSALEQMTKVSENTQFGYVAGLIGHTISATDAQGNTITGQVSAVSLQNGKPLLEVNGFEVDPNTLTLVQ